MSTSERESLEKHVDIAYFLAKKGRPFSDFYELISLQEVDGVKFSTGYNNNKACTKFINFISKLIFEESYEAILLFYVMEVQILLLLRKKAFQFCLCVDPDTFQPTVSFLYPKDLPNQDADGFVKANKSAFSIHDLHHLL